MTRIFLSTLAVAGLLSGSALAADAALPYKAAAPVQRCAADQFRGGYIGVNGGGVNWTANHTDLDGAVFGATTIVQKTWGGVVGGQVGYNWGSCNTVWGVELDGDWVSAQVNTHFTNGFGTSSINSRWDALVTARGRAGIVIDNLLLYVTGGAAAGHFKTNYSSQFLGFPGFIPPGPLNSAENNQWRWGLVAGFGTEWAWTDRISIRSEVLYVDFVDRTNQLVFSPLANFGRFTESDSAWITRIGLNIKLY
jgi:outer membrane immunogenic protein